MKKEQVTATQHYSPRATLAGNRNENPLPQVIATHSRGSQDSAKDCEAHTCREID